MKDWQKSFIALNKKDYLEEAYSIKYDNMPSKLYRFRSVSKDNKNNVEKDYNIENLNKNVVGLSSPSDFNDPYDSIPILNKYTLLSMVSEDKIVKKYLENINNKKDIKNFEEIMYNEIVNILNNHTQNLGITSFTECDYTNVLMWSHYANSHEGYCIEYDLSNLKINENNSNYLYPIFYTKEIYDLTKYIFSFLKSQAYHTKEINIANYITLATLFKAKDWAYEKEWRLVITKPLFNLKDKDKQYPFIKPSALYIGLKANENLKNTLINIAKDKNIPIYQMEQNYKEYKLNKKQITV